MAATERHATGSPAHRRAAAQAASPRSRARHHDPRRGARDRRRRRGARRAGILLEQQAEAAADDFDAQHATWAAAFSAEALEPYATFDEHAVADAVTAYFTETSMTMTSVSVGEVEPVTTACDEAASLAAGVGAFADVPVPEQPSVEGGDRNEHYVRALEQWQASQAAYSASQTLADDLGAAFADLDAICAFTLADAEISTSFSTSLDAFVDGMEHEQGDVEHVDLSASEWVEFTCGTSVGCPSYADAASRADAGERWDAAFTTYHAEQAALLAEQCPTAALADACAAGADAESALEELSAAADEVAASTTGESSLRAALIVAAMEAGTAIQSSATAATAP